MAGITPAGFTIKILQEILAEYKSSEQALIHPAIDVSDSRPLGQLNGIVSEREALLWELLRFSFSANDPDAAEGFLLDALCAITGTRRRAASSSIVTCTVNLDAGVTLPEGSTAYVQDNPTRLFQSSADVTSTTAGDYTVDFESTDTGPVVANAGTLNQIAGPVTGWNSITNPLDAALGRVADTDTVLRQRRVDGLEKNGGATPDAIRSDLLAIKGVEKVLIFENQSDSIVDGQPSHSIEVLVFDGIVPSVANDDIAQAIWNSKAAGVGTFGSITGVAVDTEGTNQNVQFSRPTVENVWLEFDVDVVGVTPTAAADVIRDYVVDQGNLQLLPGIEVVALLLKCIALDAKEDLGLTWIHDVPALRLGFSASPTETTNLPITARQIARLDTTRTIVNLV